MMQLRVRSGLHAGARRALPPGGYSLCAPEQGATADRDDSPGAVQTPITLLDWEGEALRLDVRPAGPDGAAVWLWQDQGWQPWGGYQQQTLGGLDLCIGPAGIPWPELSRPAVPAAAGPEAPAPVASTGLAAPVQPGPATPGPGPHATRTRQPAQHSAPRGRSRVLAGLLVLGLLGLVPLLWAGARTQHAPLPPPVRISAGEVEQALLARGLTELQVQEQQGGLLVRGMVHNEAQDAVARSVLRSLPAPALRTDWALASNVAATVDSALRAPQARTRYLGQGRFVVEGSVDDPQRIRSLAAQLQNDIGPALRALDVQVTPLHRPSSYVAVMVAGNVRYGERPDGTKTFEEARP